jgi:hypothetical protein
MALDAITTPTLVDRLPLDTVYKSVNGNEADASTAIAIVAAPGAGKAIYLLSVLITCDDDDADPVLQDEDDNLIFGPFYAKAAGPIVVSKDFAAPRIPKVITNKALELKAAAGGDISIWLEYGVGTAM